MASTYSGAVVPRHREVANWLLRKIESGEWPPHFQLSAEPELAKTLNVARGTVQRAIQILIDQHRLYRIPGKGTFVAEPLIEQPLGQSLLSLAEALDRQGYPVRTTVLAQDTIVELPEWVETALGAKPGVEVLHLRRLRRTADGPLAYLENFVQMVHLPGIAGYDFTTRRLFDVIEQDYGLSIVWGRRTFAAVSPSPEIMQHLRLLEHVPLLFLEQTSYLADNTPIECSRVWIRGDKFRLTAVLSR
jgi:DNA-binding GntR family transcriptional regulator